MHVIPVGSASKILSSDNYIFVCYGEDASLAASPGDSEFHIISVFSKTGQLVVGLQELLRDVEYAGTFMEITKACVVEDELVFIAYDTHLVWTLRPITRSLKTVRAPFEKLHNVLGLLATTDFLFVLRKAEQELLLDKIDRHSGSLLSSAVVPLAKLFGSSRINIADLSIEAIAGGFWITSAGRSGVLHLE